MSATNLSVFLPLSSVTLHKESLTDTSPRAGSPFGVYCEKKMGETHARGYAKAGAAPRGFAARSRVLARLALLAQIGELARRLY